MSLLLLGFFIVFGCVGGTLETLKTKVDHNKLYRKIIHPLFKEMDYLNTYSIICNSLLVLVNGWQPSLVT
ncbi:hypothetical protein GCM10025854_10720 [Tetragenococcus muriaticus]|nr:hypothetical protein GCM10025854_00540 [Tetragenococcus muriaticus]GMA46822.1 hypothetical protein GCM10025854_10720 [Tetragenococcus muriaticus]